jgi:hypothetical protein
MPSFAESEAVQEAAEVWRSMFQEVAGAHPGAKQRILSLLLGKFKEKYEAKDTDMSSFGKTIISKEAFGFCVPDMKALEAIKKILEEREITAMLSVGSGKAFFEYLLSLIYKFHQVVLCDSGYGEGPSTWNCRDMYEIKRATVISDNYKEGDLDYSSPTAFVQAWPTMLSHTGGETDFPGNSLLEFLVSSQSNSVFIYIGEGPGCCTGTPFMHNLINIFLENIFWGEVIRTQWGIHDSVQVYEKSFPRVGEIVKCLFEKDHTLETAKENIDPELHPELEELWDKFEEAGYLGPDSTFSQESFRRKDY